MSHASNRNHVPPGLALAALAAVTLHVLGTVVIGGTGWVGRGEASSSAVRHGSAPSGATSLRVRLTHPMALHSHAASLKVSDVGVEAQSLASQAASLLDQAPPAAGGGAHFASTYLSSNEIDRSPEPELGWILDEHALEQVGGARIRVRLWVSEVGRIDRVAILQAEPPGRWADDAVRPLPDTRMRPAERDGRAVAATIVVELSADLEAMR